MAKGGEAVDLQGPGAGDAAGHDLAAFGGRRLQEIGSADGRNVDADIDTIHQRTGDTRLVIGHAAGSTRAGAAGLTGHAAAAGIHGGDKLDRGGIADAVIGASDDAFGRFERLAQCLEDGMRTLKQDGMEKCLTGVTHMKEVRAVCVK